MRKMREEAQTQLQRDIIQGGVHAFPLVVAAPSLQIGIQTVVQAYGVGSLKANTIILNWLGQVSKKILNLNSQEFGKNIRWAHFYGCNIVILDAKADKWASLEEMDDNAQQIDVWWRDDATSRLMLLLAYLMTRHEKWGEAKIRLLASDCNKKYDQSVESLKAMLEEVRIEAEPEIVQDANADTIAEYSSDSSVVFLPFRIKGNQVVDPLGNPMENTLFLLPVVAMVMAAEDIDLDAEPEEGKAAEMAQASDALKDAGDKAQAALKEAEEAIETAEKTKKKVKNIVADSAVVNEEIKAKAEKGARAAEKRADIMSRKAAKATAKAETAALEAEAAGVLPEESTSEKSKS